MFKFLFMVFALVPLVLLCWLIIALIRYLNRLGKSK